MIRPRDGDIYVLRYSGHLFVKRVQIAPGNQIRLRSTNPHYEPINVALGNDETADCNDLAFIGRVVSSMHEW
ncbi:MAG: S24 family peptidase [Rhodobacteraceae bacterium]|nr:S24 family peptidase [Paracoccaceae bacterium]